MSNKKQVLVPRLRSTGGSKPSRPTSDIERSRSARPTPKMQPDSSSRLFVTGMSEQAEIDELSDDQIAELMDGTGETLSLEEMMAELDAMALNVKSEGKMLTEIQKKVTEMKTNLDSNAAKTYTIEEQMIGLLSEVGGDEQPEPPESTPKSESKSISLPGIHRTVRLEPTPDLEDDEVSLP